MIRLSREFLESRYTDQGLSCRQIAQEVRCSAPTISRYLKIYGIKARSKDSCLKELNKARSRIKTDDMFKKLLEDDDEIIEVQKALDRASI